ATVNTLIARLHAEHAAADAAPPVTAIDYAAQRLLYRRGSRRSARRCGRTRLRRVRAGRLARLASGRKGPPWYAGGRWNAPGDGQHGFGGREKDKVTA
ncbi:MAG: hypothetical protein AB7D30_10980, partial [Lysobacteraceae bacterium]